ncbi:hypothetical protein LTR56_015773 [Elasticomyces elasticus]|nr:hypothetical protein LTR56_015773 [Elasticomyces elasticus]KAK3661984.1 hypothetical protein LTR22_007155 [Elasticomyces elasticus]KAK4933151.1 hypothetical protein LTR49_000635 [Elasticomyces elasticus]KAK5755894.1 hypothetical protein LTS12_014011 [Elasticomyces elasticus]
MENSALSRLPAELRDEIWAYVLSMERPHVRSEPTPRRCTKNRYILRTRHQHRTHDYHNNPTNILPGDNGFGLGLYDCVGSHNNLALLRTCRQVLREAEKLVYTCNEFHLDVQGSNFRGYEDEHMGMRKGVRMLVTRFVAAMRGYIPQAIEIHHLDLCLYQSPGRDQELRELMEVLSDLLPLAARLPGCDFRLNVNISASFVEKGEHWRGNTLYDCIIRVEDPLTSLDDLALQLRAGKRPRTADVYSPALQGQDLEQVCLELKQMKRVFGTMWLMIPTQEMRGPWLRHPMLDGEGDDGALFSWLNTHGLTTWKRAEARPLLMKMEERTPGLRDGSARQPDDPLSTIGLQLVRQRSQQSSAGNYCDLATTAGLETPSMLSAVHTKGYESFWRQHADAVSDNAEMADDVTFAVAMARIIARQHH